ncbi:MAG: hypothetical protein OXI50_15070 [Gammaproteobacteria bacterium]|nr:hypothetical protein [Gammaproteobacteria bacterium]
MLQQVVPQTGQPLHLGAVGKRGPRVQGTVGHVPVAAGLFYPVFEWLGPVPGGLRWLFGEQGFFEPIVAGFAMMLSSLSVMANSLRLQRLRLDGGR